MRFPLDTDLRYNVAGRGSGSPGGGTGQVLDISSRGLAFRADGPLTTGLRLNVSMAWPAKLDNQTMLRLVFEGVVLRVRGGLVVVTIERPEFRTAGKGTPAGREAVADATRSIESLLAAKSVLPGIVGTADGRQRPPQ